MLKFASLTLVALVSSATLSSAAGGSSANDDAIQQCISNAMSTVKDSDALVRELDRCQGNSRVDGPNTLDTPPDPRDILILRNTN